MSPVVVSIWVKAVRRRWPAACRACVMKQMAYGSSTLPSGHARPEETVFQLDKRRKMMIYKISDIL